MPNKLTFTIRYSLQGSGYVLLRSPDPLAEDSPQRPEPAQIGAPATSDRRMAEPQLAAATHAVPVGHRLASFSGVGTSEGEETPQGARDELLSIIEELRLLNAQLKSQTSRLKAVNRDLVNLLESAHIAAIILNKSGQIRSYTPAARDMFDLSESDLGRPIAHLGSQLDDDSIQNSVDIVLRTLNTIEKLVGKGDSSRRTLLRILPYRAAGDSVAGVVINLIGASQIIANEAEAKRSAQDLRIRVESLERMLDLIPAGIFIAGGQGGDIQVNRHGARLIGQNDHKHGPRALSVPYRLFRRDCELPFWEQPLHRAAIIGASVPALELRLVRADGGSADVLISAEPLFDGQGFSRGAIAAMVDVSERRKAEARLSRLRWEPQDQIRTLLETVGSLAARMLSRAPSIDQFAAEFPQRLAAIGGLREFLFAHAWEGVTLESLLRVVLASYGGDHVSGRAGRIRLLGPTVLLDAKEAAGLGEALDELAAKSAEFGALSIPAGHLEASWTLCDLRASRYVSFFWVETNGRWPAARSEMRSLSQFIAQSAADGLGGGASLSFRSDGLRCAIEFALQGSRSRSAEIILE